MSQTARQLWARIEARLDDEPQFAAKVEAALTELLQSARELWTRVEARLDDEPQFAAEVEAALTKLLQPASPPRRRGPGLEAAFDPFVVQRESPERLRDALDALEIEQLKDIVTVYALDPRKLALKWKTKERLVDLICQVVEQRNDRGSAFRA